MAFIRACVRQLQAPVAGALRSRTPRLMSSPIIRYNSSSTKTSEKNDFSLAAQVFPLNKESITEGDVDEWLNAVQQLKGGKSHVESETEVYISQLAHPEPFLEEKFEPTEEQLAEVEAFANKRIPLPSNPTIDNFTNLIMRDGKKSKAQNILSRALYIVYLKTRKDPLVILEETLDKMAPLMATKVQKTGAAKNRTVPYPLKKRQRNRYPITWILEGATKKKSPDYSVRLAEEIISAYEGKSSGYDRKAQMHKSAMAHRAYIRL